MQLEATPVLHGLVLGPHQMLQVHVDGHLHIYGSSSSNMRTTDQFSEVKKDMVTRLHGGQNECWVEWCYVLLPEGYSLGTLV